MNFSNIFTFLKIPFFFCKSYNREAVSSIFHKVLKWDVEFYYKIISKIPSVTFVFRNCFQKRKNFFFQMNMDSEKSMNSFKMKKKIGYRIIY